MFLHNRAFACGLRQILLVLPSQLCNLSNHKDLKIKMTVRGKTQIKFLKFVFGQQTRNHAESRLFYQNLSKNSLLLANKPSVRSLTKASDQAMEAITGSGTWSIYGDA